MRAPPLLDFLIRGRWGGTTPLLSTLQPINAAWLAVIAGLGLSLIGVHAIDVAKGPLPLDPTQAAPISAMAIKQLLFLGVGLLAGLVIALPHARLLAAISWPLLLVCVGLLVFLLIPFVPSSIVTPRNGARGWINLGVADFQPAEVTKIAFALAVAHFLRYRRLHRRFIGLIAPGLIAAVPVMLITLQPDLGSASLFVPSLFAMLLAAGARLRHLAVIVIAAATAVPAAYPFMKPHQKTRIRALIQQVQGNREGADDINFQSFTAQRLVGAGGVTGLPKQRAKAMVRYNALPEPHNDMVFAVIVLRFGILGAIGTLALIGLWILSALATAAASRNPFGRLVLVGLAAFVAAQTAVNVGMTVGLLPIIGVTMPFVSYGGSSLLTSWLMTGLVFNMALHKPQPPFRDSFEYDD